MEGVTLHQLFIVPVEKSLVEGKQFVRFGNLEETGIVSVSRPAGGKVL
jgi:hypothetical protein